MFDDGKLERAVDSRISLCALFAASQAEEDGDDGDASGRALNALEVAVLLLKVKRGAAEKDALGVSGETIAQRSLDQFPGERMLLESNPNEDGDGMVLVAMLYSSGRSSFHSYSEWCYECYCCHCCKHINCR